MCRSPLQGTAREMPAKALSVAEKPSVARELAQILSGGQFQTRDGPSRYNKHFTFGCMLDGQQCDMTVTSVTGHLMEMDFEEQYRKWGSCDPIELFDAPIRTLVPDEKSDLRRSLEQAANHCPPALPPKPRPSLAQHSNIHAHGTGHACTHPRGQNRLAPPVQLLHGRCCMAAAALPLLLLYCRCHTGQPLYVLGCKELPGAHPLARLRP